jgi:hypothetical protein
MKNIISAGICILLLTLNYSCKFKKTDKNENAMVTDSTKQFGFNVNFLERHAKVIELKDGNSIVAIVPAWQGRVMTSTSEGEAGFSFGWINHELISSGEKLPHINAYGGEERLWLGPEGGQYSIFFRKGDEFVYDNWQTPDFLDTLPFEYTELTDTSVTFTHDAEIENYSGVTFNLGIEREITIIKPSRLPELTGIDANGVNCVAYRSENRLINKGTNEWKKESGLLSIWMLGMFNPSPAVTVVIPFRQGSDEDLGIAVNDNYFGHIPPDRLKITGNTVFFRADGKSRGKIGIPPMRAKGLMGSYDFENNILTLLVCKLPEGRTDYVNSAWQIQDDPYSGDALNSYNDGPLEDGSQMGPFYELETSSPAAALKPGESISHIQYTIHLTGKSENLDKIAKNVLGAGIDEIKSAF